MAQESKEQEEEIAIGVPKPFKIKLNILSNDGQSIKIKVKLKWTILQLKEHLYDHDYFKQAPFNQIISLHGTELLNSQTIEQIYDAIKNKSSKGVLRSLRGQLTWEDTELNINDLTKDNDDNDIAPKLASDDVDIVTEISLYIRSKISHKVCFVLHSVRGYILLIIIYYIFKEKTSNINLE